MAEKKKKKRKGITTKAKKKEAVARAIVRKGVGTIRINRRELSTIQPLYVQEFLREPIELAGGITGEINIDVIVEGGGSMGQAVAARAAIAKGILEYRHDDKLKKRFLSYDRMLLVDDPRRVEPKKQLGPKARKKKQKSKR
ncbi:MAG: 30S ribosomal protein S9 [archaeon]